MKNTAYALFITILLLFAACSEQTSVLEPSLNQTNFEKIVPGLGDTSLLLLDDRNKIIDNLISYTEVIDGDSGGKIVAKFTWKELSNLKMEAYLTVPKGAFEGEKEIELIFDPSTLSVDCYPSMSFNEPLQFDLKFKGIDSSYVVDTNTFNFQYIDEQGNFENIEYDRIVWSDVSRTLMVKKAELEHFSRYGWTRIRRDAR